MQIAKYYGKIEVDEGDAEERNGAVAGNRDVIHGYVGIQRSTAAQDRCSGGFRVHLRTGRRIVLQGILYGELPEMRHGLRTPAQGIFRRRAALHPRRRGYAAIHEPALWLARRV